MRWPSLSWLGISERATPSKCDFWGPHAPVAMQQGPRSKRGNLKFYPACPSSLPVQFTHVAQLNLDVRGFNSNWAVSLSCPTDWLSEEGTGGERRLLGVDLQRL